MTMRSLGCGAAQPSAVWFTAIAWLLMLGACTTTETDDAVRAAETRAQEAESRAAEQVAQAQQAAREAEDRAQRFEQEAQDARSSRETLKQSLEAAEKRAGLSEAASLDAQREVAQARRELESAREEINALAQRPDPETVVSRETYELTQARLQTAEAKLEAARIEPKPSYDVTFRGPTEMVLDQQFAISIEVSVPDGELPPSDAVFRDSIPAVSQTLRAMLYGSNFEIAYDENQDQSLVAGKAVWDFRVKPVVVGEHTLHATIIQYAPGGTGESPTNLRTDSWKVNVVVDSAPRIITAVARNLGAFAIGIITFIGGMIAEFLRRRFLGGARQSD